MAVTLSTVCPRFSHQANKPIRERTRLDTAALHMGGFFSESRCIFIISKLRKNKKGLYNFDGLGFWICWSARILDNKLTVY